MKREEVVKNLSEWRNVVQMVYRSRHDWVVKVIDWELHKKLKFDYVDKLFTHTNTHSHTHTHAHTHTTRICSRK